MGFASWQRYCTASSSGRQPNFATLNRGRHLCSAGRPSGWALAHILVLYYILHVCCITLCQRVQWRCVRVCTAEMCRAVDWQSNCFPREQQESLRNTFQLLQQISGECCHCAEYLQLEMWANAQRGGRPAEYRWRPRFNAANFG